MRRHVLARTGVVPRPGVAFTEPVSSPEDVPPTTSSGFGLRMEKVLRAAQREAAEIIASAEQDAAALLSRTRLDAEAESRERRQAWADRERAVAEAVRAGAEQVAVAQRQATENLEAVELEAQRIRGHAHNRAAEIQAAAEEAAAETVRQARLEVERLERVRDASRADLDRVVRTLGGMRDALAYELEARPGDPSHPTSRSQNPQHQNPVPQPRDGGIGIGTRPGDFRRARTAGIVPDPESGPDVTAPRAAHGSATRH